MEVTDHHFAAQKANIPSLPVMEATLEDESSSCLRPLASKLNKMTDVLTATSFIVTLNNMQLSSLTTPSTSLTNHFSPSIIDLTLAGCFSTLTMTVVTMNTNLSSLSNQVVAVTGVTNQLATAVLSHTSEIAEICRKNAALERIATNLIDTVRHDNCPWLEV